MSDPKMVETIERYLQNDLSPAERAAVETRIQTDPDFRAEVELHRDLQNALADTGQHALFGLLQDIAGSVETTSSPDDDDPVERPLAPPPPRWPLLLAILFFLSLAGVVAWFKYHVPRSPESDIPKASPIITPPPVPIQTPPAVTPSSPSETTPPPSRQPIAALDRKAFQPNRLLEPLAGGQLRGGPDDADITITQPANGATLRLREGRVRLHVAGNIEAAAQPAAGAYELLLFDNQEKSFLDKEPAARIPMDPAAGQEGQWPFRVSRSLTLTPGLYYLVAVEKGSGEPLRVVKVVLR